MEQRLLNSRKQLSNIMFLDGILGLVFGGIHLSSFLTSGSSTSLSDAGINAGLGPLGATRRMADHKREIARHSCCYHGRTRQSGPWLCSRQRVQPCLACVGWSVSGMDDRAMEARRPVAGLAATAWPMART